MSSITQFPLDPASWIRQTSSEEGRAFLENNPEWSDRIVGLLETNEEWAKNNIRLAPKVVSFLGKGSFDELGVAQTKAMDAFLKQFPKKRKPSEKGIENSCFYKFCRLGRIADKAAVDQGIELLTPCMNDAASLEMHLKTRGNWNDVVCRYIENKDLNSVRKLIQQKVVCNRGGDAVPLGPAILDNLASLEFVLDHLTAEELLILFQPDDLGNTALHGYRPSEATSRLKNLFSKATSEIINLLFKENEQQQNPLIYMALSYHYEDVIPLLQECPKEWLGNLIAPLKSEMNCGIAVFILQRLLEKKDFPLFTTIFQNLPPEVQTLMFLPQLLINFQIKGHFARRNCWSLGAEYGNTSLLQSLKAICPQELQKHITHAEGNYLLESLKNKNLEAAKFFCQECLPEFQSQLWSFTALALLPDDDQFLISFCPKEIKETYATGGWIAKLNNRFISSSLQEENNNFVIHYHHVSYDSFYYLGNRQNIAQFVYQGNGAGPQCARCDSVKIPSTTRDLRLIQVDRNQKTLSLPNSLLSSLAPVALAGFEKEVVELFPNCYLVRSEQGNYRLITVAKLVALSDIRVFERDTTWHERCENSSLGSKITDFAVSEKYFDQANADLSLRERFQKNQLIQVTPKLYRLGQSYFYVENEQDSIFYQASSATIPLSLEIESLETNENGGIIKARYDQQLSLTIKINQEGNLTMEL